LPPQAIWVLPTPVVGEGQTWEVALTTQSWGQVVLFSPFSHRKLPQTPEDVVFWTLLTMTDEVPELVFRAVCTSWMETDLSPYDVGARTEKVTTTLADCPVGDCRRRRMLCVDSAEMAVTWQRWDQSRPRRSPQMASRKSCRRRWELQTVG